MKQSSSWWDLVPDSLNLADVVHETAESAANVLRDAVGSAADAGNAAVQEALDLGAGAVEQATGVVNGVVDAGVGVVDQGGDIFDAIAETLVGGDEDVARETPPETVIPGLEEGADPAVDEAEQILEEEGPDSTYKSQRDNKSAHVAADASCSPTSFTMALIDLHGGDEASVRSQTIQFLEDVGGQTNYEQLEDLIIELLQKTDWPAAVKAKPSFFWGDDWATWADNRYGGRFYKDPNAQQYVASFYSGTSADGANTVNVEKQSDWKAVEAALDEGATATAQGEFTGSGHVVYVTDVSAEGITINDPYGLWVNPGIYVKNGATQVPGFGGEDLEALKRRAKKNSELLDVYESFESPETARAGFAKWGEQNFFSYTDASEINLGSWVSILS